MVGAAAETDLLRVLYGVQTVEGLDAVHKRRVPLGGVDQVNASLIQRHRVGGREDTDIVNIRLGGAAVAVAVNGYAVHHVDIDDAIHMSEIIGYGLARLCHRLKESILCAAPCVRPAGAAAVDPSLALARPKPDGDVFDSSAEARHRMTFKMG